MKNLLKFLSACFGLAICSVTEVDARGHGGGHSSGGRGHASSQRSAPKRSPMTGSKIQRPTSRPSPKPASRPSQKVSRPTPKPAARPKPIQRPSVQKPASRPTTRPASRPDNKPGINRPDGKPGVDRPGNRPNADRPDGRPDVSRPNARPDGGLPGTGRPDTKPMPRPDRPDKNRPATLPGMVSYPDRPGKGDRPGGGNGNRPGNGDRPGIADRPGNGGNDRPNRPNAGNEDRPNRGGIGNNSGNNSGNRGGIGNNSGNRGGIGNNNGNNRGGIANNNGIKVDNSRDRNRFDNSKKVHIDNVNVGRRNVGLNRPATLPARDRNWNSNKWGGNRGVWGNNNNININNNVHINDRYRNNFNYAYRPNYWGARPWWGANNYHGWHHGHWNYGYNSSWYHNHYYYDNDGFASGFMWGIAVWSLGNMVYDMGYNSYRNPYPAPPVQYNDSKSTIAYQEPISVTAAASPPGDEAEVKLAETKSDEALERSRAAFKSGDYVTALKADEEAIGYTPGDSTLHEYRALCLFALGKYGEAAGVLNPVLASGPGWGWDTMVDFYPSSGVYDGQLRKLEAYVKGTPEGADGHFLLGYHYLVCGHTDTAYEQFSKTVELQPADSISRQLRDLMKDSLPDEGAAEEDGPEPEAPAPIPSEKLVGTWVSQPGSGGKITFKMEEGGEFVWSFVNGEKSSELKGTYGLDDQGLLVLTTEDSQMVSSVALPQDSQMKFTLVGSPDGDPGLDFKKS